MFVAGTVIVVFEAERVQAIGKGFSAIKVSPLDAAGLAETCCVSVSDKASVLQRRSGRCMNLQLSVYMEGALGYQWSNRDVEELLDVLVKGHGASDGIVDVRAKLTLAGVVVVGGGGITGTGGVDDSLLRKSGHGGC